MCLDVTSCGVSSEDVKRNETKQNVVGGRGFVVRKGAFGAFIAFLGFRGLYMDVCVTCRSFEGFCCCCYRSLSIPSLSHLDWCILETLPIFNLSLSACIAIFQFPKRNLYPVKRFKCVLIPLSSRQPSSSPPSPKIMEQHAPSRPHPRQQMQSST